MAKYKLKEGKSLEDFPGGGGIGRAIRSALASNGFYEDFPGAQEIPKRCLPFLQEDSVAKVESPAKPKYKSSKGGK